MDHAEVIELVELAAVEPDGLARLTAGDAPDAAAVAGHLAGCPDCASELARTARAAGLARGAIRELPDPTLRERTLALVREVGRDRAAGATTTQATRPAPSDTAAAPLDQPQAPEAVTRPRTAEPSGAPLEAPAVAQPEAVGVRKPRTARPWWYAAGLAAVLVAAVVGFTAGGAARPPAPPSDGAAFQAAKTTMHIAEQGDAVVVSLEPAAGSAGSGTVMYSPTSGELAMTATGLSPAPSGAVYTCWVEQNGQRQAIGVLYVEGVDGTWAGFWTGLRGVRSGAIFGVSLVPAGAASGQPVMTGTR